MGARGARRGGRGWLGTILLLLVFLAAIPLFLILLYRVLNPPFSTLMIGRALGGVEIRQTWVPLDRISRELVAAVVTSEDAKFCRHAGVDWGAINEARMEAEKTGKGIRGASTIPMQTAKNLFLWPGRSYLRKAMEIPLAYAMSAIWPKPRMLEIYLNIAEWGPGTFGAEAAAQRHFKKSASDLTRKEAAQLAAALPNPHVRRAGKPGPRTQLKSRIIERRMTAAKPLLACLGTSP